VSLNPFGSELLKPFRYDNPSDVNMRLKGSVVRYDGRPIIVSSIRDDLSMTCFDLLTQRKLFIHSSESALDISSPPLGWVNPYSDENWPGYIMRQSLHSQKQGFSTHNARVFFPFHGITRGYSMDNEESQKVLGLTIVGEYPPLSSVLRRTRGGGFDRDWAVVAKNSTNRSMTLYHKVIPVGAYLPGPRVFLFKKGALTKTRRESLMNLLYLPGNKDYGYVVKEQL
jgi:hypothetical protein